MVRPQETAISQLKNGKTSLIFYASTQNNYESSWETLVPFKNDYPTKPMMMWNSPSHAEVILTGDVTSMSITIVYILCL